MCHISPILVGRSASAVQIVVVTISIYLVKKLHFAQKPVYGEFIQ